MMEFAEASYIEIFHLLFLDQLGRRLDKNHYTLNGGCNLRFFLKSIHYSQDLDLGLQTVGQQTLKKAVDQILESSPFHQ